MVKTIDKTSKVLKSMLVENTGRALCDSGGTPSYDAKGKYTGSQYGYGRAYERNQGVDFDAQPAAWINFSYGSMSVTRSVYHFLRDCLTFDGDMDRRFNRFAARKDNEDKCWLELAEAFPEYLRERGHEIAGLYGDGEPMCEYTYNHSNNLSQDIQFVLFTCDGTLYVLLQLHNGCDARGGLTKPRCFQADESFLSVADAQICCKGYRDAPVGQMTFTGTEDRPAQHYWYTDDAYHWYRDGACGWGAGTQLEKYEFAELPEGKTAVEALKEKPDTVFYDSDGKGYCPICGALLQAF